MADSAFVPNPFDSDVFPGGINDMPAQHSGKHLLVLLMVDATRSMIGEPIDQVNYAIAELIPELQAFASDKDGKMDLAIMSFTNSVRWELEPTNIDHVMAPPQVRLRAGTTEYGEVYYTLNSQLRKGKLLKEHVRQASPVIIMLTDGAPSDDYEEYLKDLKRNGYFALSNRAAILVGEGATNPAIRAKAQDALIKYTDDVNMVMTVEDKSKILDGIKLATIHTLKNEDLPQDTNTPISGNTNPGPDPNPNPDIPIVVPPIPGGPGGDPFPPIPDVPGGNPFPPIPDVPGGDPFPPIPGGPGGDPFPPIPGGPGTDPFPPIPGGPGGDPIPPIPGGSGSDPFPPIPGGSGSDPFPPIPGGSGSDPFPPISGGAGADPFPGGPAGLTFPTFGSSDAGADPADVFGGGTGSDSTSSAPMDLLGTDKPF